MNGVVQSWTQTEDQAYGIIRGEDDRRYEVSGKEVEKDCIGRYFLVAGETVEFQPKKSSWVRAGHGRQSIATAIVRPGKAVDIDPDTHTEYCKVKDTHWLLRSIGGLLTTASDEPERDLLSYGQIVQCNVRPDGEFKTWRAINMKIVAHSEEDMDWSAPETTQAVR